MQESQHPLQPGFPHSAQNPQSGAAERQAELHSAQDAMQGSYAGTEASGAESTMDSGTLSVGVESESANARLVNKPEIVSAIPVKNDIVFMIISVCHIKRYTTPPASRIVLNRYNVQLKRLSECFWCIVSIGQNEQDGGND